MLILSDGMDNTSRYSKGELMRAALEADVQIYTIIVGNFRAQNDVEAKEAAIKARRALRNQYVIGYQPPSSGATGKWHRIRVKSNVPKVNVSARNGYYSP